MFHAFDGVEELSHRLPAVVWVGLSLCLVLPDLEDTSPWGLAWGSLADILRECVPYFMLCFLIYFYLGRVWPFLCLILSKCGRVLYYQDWTYVASNPRRFGGFLLNELCFYV